MEIVTTNNLNIFDNDKINGIYGDIIDLENLGLDINGITYDDKWSVNRFLHCRKNKKRIESIFNYLNIDLNVKNKKIKDLSSTEFKWILLAYMIINKKKIIIFDYFDIGLINKEQKKLINIIKKLKKDGNKIIIVSNNILFLNKVIDCLYIIKDGCILYEGSVENILEKKYIELPEIINFIKLANKKKASLDYTLDNNELLKNIYRSIK